MSDPTEIEFKFAADHITFNEFSRFFVNNDSSKEFKDYQGLDDYYDSPDGSVIRHRWNKQNTVNEVTVKMRRTHSSIVNRIEQNIDLIPDCKQKDFEKFLELISFKKVFSLYKKAVIVWIDYKEVEFTVSLYNVKDIKKQKSSRTFFEIEVESSNNLSDVKAENILYEFTETLKDQFKLKQPLNLSLYEIYSNKMYKVKQ